MYPIQKTLISWVVLLTAAVSACAAEPLRLNSGVSDPYFQPGKKGFLELLIPEIFKRICVEAEAVQYMASERAMINANNGIDDGIALRIKGLEKSYPNLVRVEEKIIDNEFVAFSIRHAFATTSFDTLRGHQVGYINGWKVFETNLPADIATTKVQDVTQLFNLLANDRADIVLYERWQGEHVVSKHDIKATMLRPPLVTTEMFMYLHKKHAHLAEPAAQALRRMKSDGSYQRIAAQTLPPQPVHATGKKH